MSRNKVYLYIFDSVFGGNWSLLLGLPVQTCLHRAWNLFVNGRNSCRSKTDDSPLSKIYKNVSNISFFYPIPFVLLSLSSSILVYQFQVNVCVVLCIFVFSISHGKMLFWLYNIDMDGVSRVKSKTHDEDNTCRSDVDVKVEVNSWKRFKVSYQDKHPQSQWLSHAHFFIRNYLKI